jgi:hypothetical protein
MDCIWCVWAGNPDTIYYPLERPNPTSTIDLKIEEVINE